MNNIITTWLPLADLVAKIATTIGIIGLFVAFFNYRHSVAIAKRSERRAAVELAAKECVNFGSVLMPQFMKLRKDIEVGGCEFFSHYKLIREAESLKSDASAVTAEDYSKLNGHLSEILHSLNSMEGFAIPFTAGVADDNIGFLECGRAFVANFEQFFGIYARHELKHFYPSTQTLYWRWRKQMEKDDRRRMHLNAGKEFFALTEEIIRTESNSKIGRFASSMLKRASDEIAD